MLEYLNRNMQAQLDKISGGMYQANFVTQKLDSKKKRSLDTLDIDVFNGSPDNLTFPAC